MEYLIGAGLSVAVSDWEPVIERFQAVEDFAVLPLKTTPPASIHEHLTGNHWYNPT